MEVGHEYVVLALEASPGNALMPAGLMVFVGLEYDHTSAPVSCFEVLDARVSPAWRLGRVGNRWLIGYPLMLDENFQIGLERGDEPQFLIRYRELLTQAARDRF
jgi:hypothetical protein